MRPADGARGMEVLFVTSTLPYPPNSGSTIRTYNLIRRLAGDHRLHLVAYGSLPQDSAKVHHLGRSCASVTVVPLRETKRTPRFYLELLLNLLSPSPFVVSRFTRPAMARAIREIVGARRLDVIHCDFLTLSLNLPEHDHPPVIATAHNVESVIWKRYLAHERNPLKAAYIYVQYRKLLRFERKILGRFDGIACVSEDEEEQLRRICPSARFFVVPNGVDVEHFTPVPDVEAPHHLVFTGSMDWRPNQDAVRFFLDRIYPRIKKAEPRASLSIIGRDPPASLKTEALAHEDVRVVGTVPDMRPHLASAAVYIVPLRIGGGTRLKILEAMAMARPVVSTRVGCEGLSVVPDRDLLVADSPDEFARAVLRLLGDRALAGSMGQAGHRAVREAYDWGPIAVKLAEAWREAASGRRR